MGRARGGIGVASGRGGLTAVTSPPPPSTNPDTQPFWDACARHELRLQRCDACSTFRFYPGPMCPSCGSFEHEWVQVTGRGEVYSYVIVRRAASSAFNGEVPYATALVELEGAGGIRLPARIVDCPVDDVAIEMAVEVVFETASEGFTVPVFRPVAGSAGDEARVNRSAG